MAFQASWGFLGRHEPTRRGARAGSVHLVQVGKRRFARVRFS